MTTTISEMREIIERVDANALEDIPKEHADKILELASTSVLPEQIVARSGATHARHMDLTALLTDLANLATIVSLFITVYQAIRPTPEPAKLVILVRERLHNRLQDDPRIDAIAAAVCSRDRGDKK